ncbi:MAG: signal transduction histidine kinase [Verrucomicrobiales bacterium]|jgi:signal transduction histidine kinase
MRRRLILVFVAVSLLVVSAFVVPLGVVVRRTAEDRAIDVARTEAASIVPTLVIAGTAEQIQAAVRATSAGRAGDITVITSQGWTIGPEVDRSANVREALASGGSNIGPADGGLELVSAVSTGPGQYSAIRVFVPDSARRQGQSAAWLALLAVGAALVGITVVVADRLAQSIVRPTRNLASAARLFGDGALDTRVVPDGPSELVELAGAFNDLGSQVSSMLQRERELVAELSHRLRTPLTKLRMRLEHVDDPELASSLRGDLDDVTAVVNRLIGEVRGSLANSAGCEVGAVMTERAEFWSVLAEDQGRPWGFQQSSGRLRVHVSESELAAAIDVLFENVFRHTEERTSMQVGFGAIGSSVKIWVADGGPGIDPASTGRGVSSSGSTGLGLDIVRAMAEAANGSVEIDSSNLGGALVTITLPRAVDASA